MIDANNPYKKQQNQRPVMYDQDAQGGFGRQGGANAATAPQQPNRAPRATGSRPVARGNQRPAAGQPARGGYAGGRAPQPQRTTQSQSYAGGRQTAAGRQTYTGSGNSKRYDTGERAAPQQRYAGGATATAKQGYAGGRSSTAARPSYTGGSGGPPKKKKKTGKVLVAVFMALLVLGTGVFAIVNIIQNRIDGTVTQAGVLPVDGMTVPEFKGDHVSFLVCGLDYDNEGATGYTSENKVGRTDMILYVYFNVKDSKISLLQIPRDSYVGDSARTGGTGKINSLYYCAEDKDNRMAALSKVINEQFRLPVDFYVTIDLDALKALVDVIGTIEVYVPMTITDPENNAELEEGWRHLEGDQLEFFLRNRKSPNYNGQGDIARLRMQQSFYSALFREFKQLTAKDLMMWMNVLTYYCKTDKDIVGLSSIALKALSVDGADITFVRPPCGAVMHNGVSLVSLEGEGTAELLNEYFRPEGQSYGREELGMYTLTIPASTGVIASEVKTMSGIQAEEPAK